MFQSVTTNQFFRMMIKQSPGATSNRHIQSPHLGLSFSPMISSLVIASKCGAISWWFSWWSGWKKWWCNGGFVGWKSGDYCWMVNKSGEKNPESCQFARQNSMFPWSSYEFPFQTADFPQVFCKGAPEATGQRRPPDLAMALPAPAAILDVIHHEPSPRGSVNDTVMGWISQSAIYINIYLHDMIWIWNKNMKMNIW